MRHSYAKDISQVAGPTHRVGHLLDTAAALRDMYARFHAEAERRLVDDDSVVACKEIDVCWAGGFQLQRGGTRPRIDTHTVPYGHHSAEHRRARSCSTSSASMWTEPSCRVVPSEHLLGSSSLAPVVLAKGS